MLITIGKISISEPPFNLHD